MTEGMLAGIGNTPAVRLERLVEPGMGHRVLTAQVDSGLKYLAGSLFHDEHV